MNLKKDLWLKYHLNFSITGGNGEGKENAIVILLKNNLGILLEKDIVAYMFCGGEYNFKLIEQFYQEDNGQNFDILKVELPNGVIKEIYFEISNFFGKSMEYFNRDSKKYIDMIRKMTIRPSAEEEMSWFK